MIPLLHFCFILLFISSKEKQSSSIFFEIVICPNGDPFFFGKGILGFGLPVFFASVTDPDMTCLQSRILGPLNGLFWFFIRIFVQCVIMVALISKIEMGISEIFDLLFVEISGEVGELFGSELRLCL